MRKAGLLSLTLLAGAIPAFADQAPVNPQSNTGFGALRKAQPANPYARLFDARDVLTQALQEKSASAAAPQKRTLVCGMTIIEAPPFFDQRMKVEPPKDSNVRYTIRAVEPTVCDSK